MGYHKRGMSRIIERAGLAVAVLATAGLAACTPTQEGTSQSPTPSSTSDTSDVTGRQLSPDCQAVMAKAPSARTHADELKITDCIREIYRAQPITPVRR